MFRRLLLATLCALFLARTAVADEVRLKNGDRYSGDVVSLAAGTLTFKTAHGPLTIPWSEVTALIIAEPLLVTIAPAPPVSATVTSSDGTVLLPSGAFKLGDITALARPLPPLVVEGGASAGIITTGGNTDVNSVRLDGDLMVRQTANRYKASAVVNRAKDTGVETAENWTTSFGYDRFLTPRLYVNASTILTHDTFRDLDLRTAIGAGVGYQVIDTPRVTLTTDAGIGYVNENVDVAPDDAYTAAHEAAKLDVFALAKRAQLFHAHDGYFGGDDNLFFRMQNGVRIGLVGRLISTLEWDLDYDKSPAPGRDTTDRTLALTFGYKF